MLRIQYILKMEVDTQISCYVQDKNGNWLKCTSDFVMTCKIPCKLQGTDADMLYLIIILSEKPHQNF